MNINSINDLSQEICGEIFSYLTGPELRQCSQASKEWKEITESNRVLTDIVENQFLGSSINQKRL